MTSPTPVTFSPTPEQEAIISAAKLPDSLMLKAYAGCAKTSTLELAARQVKAPALALAFNKSIVKELTGKLPANFEVKSLNGLGHGAWLRGNPGMTVKLEDKKIGKLVTEVGKDFKVPLDSDQWDQLRRLVGAAMAAGLTPGDMGRPLTPDLPASWAELADECWIPKPDFEYIFDLAREVLARSVKLAFQGVICFDDQVYASVCLGGKFPQFPQVFVDEAQDLSPLNHAMLALTVRAGGRLVVVGDPKQAIYGFRGADASSMDTMRGLAEAWRDLPLTLTFRCPQVVVERQQEHAPGYRAAPTNRVGHFKHLTPLLGAPEGSFGWTLANVPLAPAGSLAVLCRNNAPLLAFAFKCLRQGTSVVMLGRDIGKGLVSLSKKISPEDLTPIDRVRGQVDEWELRERSLALANGHEEKVAGIVDRAECFRAVADFAGPPDAGRLRRALTELFSRTAGRVTLASIHKAKGLEWDSVVLLDPWRIPSKAAKAAARAGDNRQLLQEFNLRYVAETRTKDTLVLANLEDFQ